MARPERFFPGQREIVTVRLEAELNEVAAGRAAAHGQPDRALASVE